MERERDLPTLLGEITGLLEDWTRGDEQALRDLIPRVYGQLRSIADRLARKERFSRLIQPTVLVNELYMRLAEKTRADALRFPTRLHFYAFAGTVMRRILVDEVRRRTALRSGGQVAHVALEEELDAKIPREGVSGGADQITLLSLHRALQKLAQLDPRQARIVEHKYFAGLTVMEISLLVGLSRATVNRELQTARVLLAREMSGDSDGA